MSLRSTALLYAKEKSLSTEAMNYSPTSTSTNLTLKSSVCWAVCWEKEKGLAYHSKKARDVHVNLSVKSSSGKENNNVNKKCMFCHTQILQI